jgi:hypothetical protein
MSSPTTGTRWLGMKPGAIIGIGAGVLAVILIAVFAFFIPQGIQTDATNKMANLNKVAAAAFGKLSECESESARAAQSANAKTDAAVQIMREAIGGRWGEGSKIDRGSIFQQMQEAYPDKSITEVTSIYDQVMEILVGCQRDVLADQNRMIGAANDFVAWRGGFMPRTYGAKTDYPDDTLSIHVGNLNVSGPEALIIMQRPIVSGNAAASVGSGINEQANSDPFGRPAPATPAPTAPAPR